MIDNEDTRRAIFRLNLLGYAIIALLIGGIGGWAATSELSGAVIAVGTLVVESNVKKVQHQSGGIVGEILVREGDTVVAGQIVMRLDDTLTRASLGIVRSQLDELSAREARLLAEQNGAARVGFPEELTRRQNDALVAGAMGGEATLFEARRMARAGQRAQLQERIAQIGEEVRGLEAQRQAKEQETSFIGKELEGVEKLYEQNLTSIVRYMQLQRDKARLEGEYGQLVAEVARARGRASETELQILQLEQDFRTELLKELREVQAKLAELRERLTVAEDQLRRVDIRALQAGVVHQLAVHTVGGVIGNGETLMQIVPESDALVVDAKVAPSDVDQVTLGARVTIRIIAGNPRTAPDLVGEVVRISADLTREPQVGFQPEQAYYLVRIALKPGETERLGDVRLLPGMAAESFIETSARTPIAYLLKPLNEQITRTFRER